MVVEKFVRMYDSAKGLKEVTALVTSAGAQDAGKIMATNAQGKMDDTLLPAGVGPEVQTAVATEALAANDVVNIYDDTGTLSCRKADASDGTKKAHGFVKASVEMGANATIYTDGFLPGVGLTKGSLYFLSETSGLITSTPPTTAGAIVQAIGAAVSATAIKFDPDHLVIERA